ncbi:hypothetical protein GCM10010124_32810 [Pilimelia terevasa]|uniref:FxsA family protein n=1 Tax=Pilimelia terevasa TaxID=53372 RepID=A0A8J3BU85_9ACTN|nr:FxsA family protein [Pilimelia terevasa]GGK37441.1 hypothetical protein GCM10010124_32810 [Pilimelia terevasa]
MRRLVSAVAVAGLVLAVAEFAVFVAAAHRFGFWPPVAVSLLTSWCGLWLARREGARAWRRLRAELAAGRPPGLPAVAGAAALAGAVLIALPGLLGDVLGLVLWSPPVRRLVAAVVAARPGALVGWFGARRVRSRVGRERGGPPPGGDARPRPGAVVEGEILDR